MAYHILLVEDEGLIRLTLAETLEDAGYAGDRGRQWRRGPRPDPRVDGIRRAADRHPDARRRPMASTSPGSFHERHPNSPVVFMTGRPDMLSRVGRLAATEALLRKPFGPRADARRAGIAAGQPRLTPARRYGSSTNTTLGAVQRFG